MISENSQKVFQAYLQTLLRG